MRTMKRILYGCLEFLAIIFVFIGVYAQDTTSTTEPLPTLSRNSPYWDVFPVNLTCYNMTSPSEGPAWGDITIGVSTAEDLKNYVRTIGNYDGIYQWADYISFWRNGASHDKSGPPPLVEACLDISTQKVTALKISNNRPTYIGDLVAVYGIPDTVTWGTSNISRTVFWFREGISALVYIVEDYDLIPYGEIGLIVYFPYQHKQNFDESWPYNSTNAEYPEDRGDVIESYPTPSQLQNPFNFDTMIATITAQPSRTSTPTYAPTASATTLTPSTTSS